MLAVLGLVQFFLLAMLLGLYIGDIKIGINPFVLFRDVRPDLPLFSNPNYAELIDGSGFEIPTFTKTIGTLYIPLLFFLALPR